MALDIKDRSNTAYVNTSRENIKVYKDLVTLAVAGGDKAGGRRIGTIYPGEYYIFIYNKLNSSESWAEIAFNDGNGGVKKGYIDTKEENMGEPGVHLEEYSFVRKQEPYHYFRTDGRNLIRNRKKDCNGEKLYVFELSYNSPYRDKYGKILGELKSGTLVGLDNSTMGDKYQDYIAVSKIKPRGERDWQTIDNKNYGWVQMQLDEGSQPSDRNLV